MSVWNPLSWGAKSAPETKSTTRALGLSRELGDFLIFGSNGNAATAAGAMALYSRSTAVSIPVNYIADAFSSIVPVLKDGTEIINDHPILDLLNNPSEFYTANLFFEILAKSYLITGETEIVAIGSLNRPPLELQPINPQNVTVVQGSGGIASSLIVSGDTLTGSYVLDTRGNRTRYVRGNLAEIKQIRSFSTRDNSLLRGESVLVSASAEVRQNIEGNSHNVALLTNGGRVSLVFSFEEDLSQDDFEAAKLRIRSQYSGPDNAGKIAVTAGGKIKIDELGSSNKDMDFAELQSMSKEAVALQYKFPLPMLSNKASTFNNYREAKTALYDDAVLPLASVLFQGLTALLMPRYGLDPAKVQITYDIDQITALSGRRNEELKLRKELGIETVNELRALIGREPVEGGDNVLAPANMIPIGSDLFTDDNTEDAALARDGK